MIRCAHGAFGEHPCTDEAELIMDGRGLCEAHAMDRAYDRRARDRAEWESLMAGIEMMRHRDEILERLLRAEVATDSLQEQRPRWWLPITKRFSRADVKPKA